MITDNDDLLIEILLWLPAKSLIRFKLVSKKWFDLISSHHFSEQHTLQQRHRHRHSKLRPSLLLHLAEASSYLYLHSSPNGEKLVPYAFSSSLASPTIRSFSNGLFLLQCRNVESPFEVCRSRLQSSHKAVQEDLAQRGSHTTPRRSSSLCRSWWRRCQTEVYESDTSTWKVCGEPFLAPRELVFDHGIEWKDCIHWCGVFFDLQECSIGQHPEIVVPGDAETGGFLQKYVESNGFLHNVSHFPTKKSVMVFELYSEWSLKYHINLDGGRKRKGRR
ncbi:hypothetical protein SASPL_157787 [Salvia splendens]|uniref:F-box domain-containing protein n=1 Tax=Salvia splendens TaxID=180675 RepID=A0A8X8YTQ4_SALSN|nr:hypothetical protein SASPL_157787 [Salvia splendens]